MDAMNVTRMNAVNEYGRKEKKGKKGEIICGWNVEIWRCEV